MVCPTFLHQHLHVTDLTGTHAERRMEWAPCFELDFTTSTRVRYGSPPSRHRYWLTHKLSSWHDQFGSRVALAAVAVSPGAPPD